MVASRVTVGSGCGRPMRLSTKGIVATVATAAPAGNITSAQSTMPWHLWEHQHVPCNRAFLCFFSQRITAA